MKDGQVSDPPGLPVEIELMKLAARAESATQFKAWLAQARGAHTEELRRCARFHPEAWRVTHSILKVLEEETVACAREGPARVAALARAFDRAAIISPEASVALFCFGHPGVLREATEDVALRLRDWGLLGGRRRLLDFGCGIGRFEERLAPEVEAIVGIDISQEMVAAARGRCRPFGNVIIRQADPSGRLDDADEAFDGVLAIDSMPYLVEAGWSVVEVNLLEFARVLRPGGDVLILNFSYRGDVLKDRQDLERLTALCGLSLTRASTGDFTRWDGAAFRLAKGAAERDARRPNAEGLDRPEPR